MNILTDKQREILKSFRCSVSDILKSEHDDHFLLRWLRARNFNEEKAEAMLRKSLTWRKQVRADNFLEHYEMPEVFEKYHPGGFLGHDKEGCPVWLINSGCMDVKGFVQSCRRSEFLKYQIYRFEYLMNDMKSQSNKLNRNIGKKVYIMDEEHLAVGQILNKSVLETLLDVFSVFEANYPETLKRCYVVNVSKLFYALYSAIKPLLSEETAEKVKIYGTEGWKEALLQDIDASVLPVHWGGTRVDAVTGDPKCTSLINMGGTVPEHYYLDKRDYRLRNEKDVKTTNVPKRDFVDVEVEVPKPGSVVNWEVETDENDLGVGFYQRLEHEEDLEELIPCMRTETFRAYEPGSYECTKAGTYILRLDNTFSWFSSKQAYYRIHINPPPKEITM